MIGAIRHGGAAAWMGILVRMAAPITSKIAFSLPLRKSPDIHSVKGVFIFCPPRSGGTAIYQAISHALPSMPLTNGHVLFLKLGSHIYRKFKKSKNAMPAEFNNFNGYTSSLHGVNEGNEFFTWPKVNKNLEKNFLKLTALLGPIENESIVLKNVRTYENIASIYKACSQTGILFVRVKRNPQKIIESSLKVFRRTGVFHPIPNELQGTQIEDPVRFAVKQITLIEKVIDEQLENIPDSRKYVIAYEEFCDDPYTFIEEIALNYLGYSKSDIRHVPAIENMHVSSKQKVPDETVERISVLLKERLK